MRIEDCLVVANAKGGVGKSSCASNLGVRWAQEGHRVLIVDLDPQANLTCEEFGIEGDGGRSLLAAAMDMIPTALPVPSGRERLDLIAAGPSTRQLGDYMGVERGRDIDAPAKMLHRGLANLEADYDIILIDTPAAAGHVLADAALAVGEWLLIPTRTDESSIAGINMMISQAREVARDSDPIKPVGVFLFAVASGATRVREDVRAALLQRLGGRIRLFDTVIRYSEKAAVDGRLEGHTATEYAVEAAGADWKLRLKDPTAKTYASAAAGLAADYAALAAEVEAAAIKELGT